MLDRSEHLRHRVLMRKAGGGAIVNISSGAGFTATFGLAAYVASK